MIKITDDIYLADDFNTLNLVIGDGQYKTFRLYLDAYNERYDIVKTEGDIDFTAEQIVKIETFLQQDGDHLAMKVIAEMRSNSQPTQKQAEVGR